MLFNYTSVDQTGAARDGQIDAINIEVAISALQKKGFVISKIKPIEDKKPWLDKIPFLGRVKTKDVVILSRQISTLFQAQVSALRVFKLLASESENPILRRSLSQIATDLEGGSTISKALSAHPDVFNSFYVNMVKAGEESGKLDETFSYLADHLDRTYEVTSKAKNAFIYPIFVVFTFFAVMFLMFTLVIPKISGILTDSGQEIPVYTKVVLAISNFLVNYGAVFIIFLLVMAYIGWRYERTSKGQMAFAKTQLSIPYVGTLYKKLYLSRIADNMNTMLQSGIPMLRALEITSTVVGSGIYKDILTECVEVVKGGSTLSDAMSRYEEIPTILIQMIKVGEETGELGEILKTMSKFYQREVVNAVDTLVDLIEPLMIVVLGVGVGLLLASVLVPIYNVASSIG